MKTATKVLVQISVILVLIAGAVSLGLQSVIAKPVTQTTNLALNKPVTFSSQQAGNEASHAVDGDTATRWAASPWPQWIRVDLGTTYTIDKTEIMPYAGRAYQYRVEVSLDGTSYTTVVDRTANTTGGTTLTDTFTAASARYVRLTVTGASGYTGGWASLYEFRVFSSASVATATRTPTPISGGSNLALNRPATCSSVENTGTPCASSVDGNTGTRWSSAFSDPQWIQVDLGSTATIGSVVLRWEAAYARSFQIQTSTDAATWTTIYSTTTGTGGVQTLNLTGSGRYIRMYGTVRATVYGYSLWEFEVYGTGGPTATPGPTVTPIPTATGWNLVWSDEFNGPNVDLTNWSFQTGCSGWGNAEWEDYTNGANASIQNGSLVIVAQMKPGAALGACGMTSTRMNTSGKRSWLYGKMEARIAIPIGQGTWPAFWMMGNTGAWPSNGEMDIMEHINSTDQNVGTLHWNNNGHQSSGTSTTVSNMTSYHIYGIEWDSTQVKFYVDGNYYNTINISAVPQPAFHQPQYFLLNLAIGGAWPGYPTSTNIMPAYYYIDYVRVYQH